MKNSTRDTAGRARQAFTARARVAAYLQEACGNDGQLPANLGEMAQRCITEENLAKLDLVFDAENPGAACYSDLIRELYMEAQGGVHLVREDSPIEHLRALADDPGISGELYREMPTIAPRQATGCQ